MAIYKCSWEVEPGTTLYQDQIQRVVRTGLEPGISGSQGNRPKGPQRRLLLTFSLLKWPLIDYTQMPDKTDNLMPQWEAS